MRRPSSFRPTHARRLWRDYQWPLIGVVGLAAVVLGYLGFARYFQALGTPRAPLNLLYLSLQLIVMESGNVPDPLPWELEVARLLAPAVVAYTAWQAAAVIFREQLQLLGLRFFRDHVVICGLGRKGLLLTQAFRARGERVVVIEQDEANSHLEQAREAGALVLIGSAGDPLQLRKARLAKARHLIAVCGGSGTNAEIAVHAHELVKQDRGGVVTCLLHVVDPHLCELLRGLELATEAQDRFRLEFFNIFERGARAMLDEHPPFVTAPDGGPPHLLIVGLGPLGENLVAQAALRLSRQQPSPETRLSLTMVGPAADAEVAALQSRYPSLDRLCAIKTYSVDTQSAEFQRGAFLFGSDGRCEISRAYVCLEDDARSLSAALALRHRLRADPVPIAVRMHYQAGLATLLGKSDQASIGLTAFPLLDRTCRPELLLCGTHEILARAIHEDYVRGQRAAGKTADTNPSMVA